MFGKKLSEEHLKKLQSYKHTDKAKIKIKDRSFGENNPNAKLVLNIDTGIFYGCVKNAADTIGIKRDILKQYLNGRRKNKTSFVYV